MLTNSLGSNTVDSKWVLVLMAVELSALLSSVFLENDFTVVSIQVKISRL